MNRKGKREVKKREGDRSPAVSCAVGVLMGLLTVMFALMACAGLIGGEIIPEQWHEICVPISGVLGGAVGSLSGLKLLGKRGVGLGCLFGAALAMILGVSGVLLYGEADAFMCALMTCCCVSGGGVGGWLSFKRRKRRR